MVSLPLFADIAVHVLSVSCGLSLRLLPWQTWFCRSTHAISQICSWQANGATAHLLLGQEIVHHWHLDRCQRGYCPAAVVPGRCDLAGSFLQDSCHHHNMHDAPHLSAGNSIERRQAHASMSLTQAAVLKVLRSRPHAGC